jgi:hypothetical protein
LACFREKVVGKATEDIEAIKARHRAAVADLVEEFAFDDRVEAINVALEQGGLLPMSHLENHWIHAMEREAFTPKNIAFVVRAMRGGLKPSALDKFWKGAKSQATSPDFFPLLRHKIKEYFGADVARKAPG